MNQFSNARKISQWKISRSGLQLTVLLTYDSCILTQLAHLIFLVPSVVTFWLTWAFSTVNFLLQNLIFTCLFSGTLFRVDHFNAFIFFHAFLRLILIHFIFVFLSKCQQKINRGKWLINLILFAFIKKNIDFILWSYPYLKNT